MPIEGGDDAVVAWEVDVGDGVCEVLVAYVGPLGGVVPRARWGAAILRLGGIYSRGLVSAKAAVILSKMAFRSAIWGCWWLRVVRKRVGVPGSCWIVTYLMGRRVLVCVGLLLAQQPSPSNSKSCDEHKMQNFKSK